jgi:hypothetical protein
VFTGVTTSAPTGRIALAAEPKVVRKPAVQGRIKAGYRVTAAYGAYSVYGGTTTLQWLRNGKSISKANRTSYVLTSADRGRQISVRAVYSVPGYRPVSSVSAARKVS